MVVQCEKSGEVWNRRDEILIEDQSGPYSIIFGCGLMFFLRPLLRGRYLSREGIPDEEVEVDGCSTGRRSDWMQAEGKGEELLEEAEQEFRESLRPWSLDCW